MKILAFMITEEHKQVVGFSALILYTVNLLMLLPGCPRRSYKVLYCLIFVFTFIKLLERSYFCLFLWKGLMKVLFLVLNETSM